jgi:hypothetical protein
MPGGDRIAMYELTVNLHMHTTYSDGSGIYSELARSALRVGIDVLLVTDHNVWVRGVDRYYREGNKRTLLLASEEIHDQDREPQKNHLLVFGADRELGPLADNPQELIDAVRAAGGLSFLAHPVDPALPAFGEEDISWEDWTAKGYTGIELWNGFSELKSVVRNRLDGIFYAYFPEYLARGPLPETLSLWDSLLVGGARRVAVGGSDAHARHMSLGPLRRVIFPYDYHFSTVNTHVLVDQPPTGDVTQDKRSVLAALGAGHCFIGYDLPAPTRGFRFSAQGKSQYAVMGDELLLEGAVTLQVKLPQPASLRLLKDGKEINSLYGEALVHTTSEAGVYRLEAYKNYLGRKRGWIFSNPIYIR